MDGTGQGTALISDVPVFTFTTSDQGVQLVAGFNPNQPRDSDGKWSKIPGVSIPSPDKQRFKKLIATDADVMHGEMQAKKKWTTTQIKALRDYASDGHKKANAALRGMSAPDAKTKKLIADARAGMRPASRDVVVFRGTWPAQFGIKTSMLDPAWKDEFTSHVGEVFHDPAFASTSTSAFSAFKTGLTVEIETPKGTPLAYIASISANPSEREVVLAPDLHYQLLSFESTMIGPVARMRVVPPPPKNEDVGEIALDVPPGDPVPDEVLPDAVAAPDPTPKPAVEPVSGKAGQRVAGSGGKKVTPAIIYKKHADGTVVGEAPGRRMRWDAGAKKFVVERRQDGDWQETSQLTKSAAYEDMKQPGRWFEPGSTDVATPQEVQPEPVPVTEPEPVSSQTPEPTPTVSAPTAEINGVKKIDPAQIGDVLYREPGAISAADLQNMPLTHTTKVPDILRQEGFDPKKGKGHGQLLGRGTYVALDQATAQLYQESDTTTLPVKIDSSAKFLSVSSKDEYGMLRDAAKLLPGGEARWLALTKKWKEKGDPEPGASALRQIALKEGWDGLLVRAPHTVDKDIYGFAGGGNQVVVWTPNKVHLNEVAPQQVTITTDQQGELSDVLVQLQSLREAAAPHVEVRHAYFDKASKKKLDWYDHKEFEQAQKELALIEAQTAPATLRALDLLELRDGAPWGSVDYDVTRWENAGKPSAVVQVADTGKVQKARDQYVMNDLMTITHNASLRSGSPTSAAKAWRGRMRTMVTSSVITNDATVYRGAALRPEQIMTLRPGAVVRDPGIMSTDETLSNAEFYVGTRRKNQPGTLSVVFKIHVPAQTPGVDVQYGEYVFADDTELRIVSSQRTGDRVDVVAEMQPKVGK